MSSRVPPAASTAALRFSQTCRVCASISPTPALVPSARRDVMPEMKTMVPRAAIAVAWEKCPLGWRLLLETICFLGMLSSCWGPLTIGRDRRKCGGLRLEAREIDGAVADDAIEQVDLPGEIVAHRLGGVVRALVGFEPGVDGLVRHARI